MADMLAHVLWHVRSAAETAGIPASLPAAERFLRCVGIPTEGSTALSTIVSETGVPVEYCVSSSPVPTLKVLAESPQSAASVADRILSDIDAVIRLASDFQLGGDADVLRNLLLQLLPDASAWFDLDWRAVAWPSLRTDGVCSALRVYVNTQSHAWGHRYLRVLRFIAAGGEGSEEAVLTTAAVMERWATLVGVSVDLTATGARLARLHFAPTALSVRRLQAICSYAGAIERLEDVVDFIRLVHGRDRLDCDTLLLSIGMSLGVECTDIKVDVTTRRNTQWGRSRTRSLPFLERRFGTLTSLPTAWRDGAGPDALPLQYIGLTVERRTVNKLSAYFGAPPMPRCGARMPSAHIGRLHLAGTGRVRAPVRPMDAVNRVVGFLQSTQLASGQFPCERYHDPGLRGPGVGEISPFATTIIVRALSSVEGAAPAAMVRKGVEFLRRARDPSGTWRYWVPPLRSDGELRVDPDVDDTASVAEVLSRCAPASFAETASLTDQALLGNLRGDHFVTWIRELERPNDVDMVVNANVLTYLGARSELGPVGERLCAAVRGDLGGQNYWYYLDPLALYHAFSRAYAAGAPCLSNCVGAAVARTLTEQRRDGSFGNELRTALALATLRRCRANAPERVRAAETWLLQQQAQDGSWARSAFFAGPEPPRAHSVWWGSSALTSGLVLDALTA